MAEEKKNSTLAQEKAELDKKVADEKKALDSEKLSEDELNAVAGGYFNCPPGTGYDEEPYCPRDSNQC